MKVTRLFDLLQYQLENFPKDDALCCKSEREWKKYATKQVIQNANRVSLALLKSGIKKDDKIAIISQNRPEWNFIDYGAQQIGAVIVPIYPTITVEDFKFIFTDAEVKMVFVADYELYTKANEAAKNITSIIGIFSFNEISDIPHWTSLTKIINEDDTNLLETHRA
ncbi:MAG TPA: AMP-binding protein, partial [Cytophagaceae bacterium]